MQLLIEKKNILTIALISNHYIYICIILYMFTKCMANLNMIVRDGSVNQVYLVQFSMSG